MLIAIEGIDGSGKGTQTQLLIERLHREGYTAASVSFPRYGQTRASEKIARYLNGEMGPLEEVSPYRAAELFANDRLESKPYLEGLIRAHDVVLADRYVASNYAYQGARVPEKENREIRKWIFELEFEANGLPEPVFSLYLDVIPVAAHNLVARKDPRTYTQSSHDLHERDVSFQARVHRAYRHLAKEGTLGGALHRVHCMNADGTLATIKEIHEAVWKYVQPVVRQTAD